MALSQFPLLLCAIAVLIAVSTGDGITGGGGIDTRRHDGRVNSWPIGLGHGVPHLEPRRGDRAAVRRPGVNGGEAPLQAVAIANRRFAYTRRGLIILSLLVFVCNPQTVSNK